MGFFSNNSGPKNDPEFLRVTIPRVAGTGFSFIKALEIEPCNGVAYHRRIETFEAEYLQFMDQVFSDQSIRFLTYRWRANQGRWHVLFPVKSGFLKVDDAWFESSPESGWSYESDQGDDLISEADKARCHTDRDVLVMMALSGPKFMLNHLKTTVAGNGITRKMCIEIGIDAGYDSLSGGFSKKL